MAHLSGKAGAVTVAGSEVKGIKSWTLDYVFEALETTDFEDGGVRSYIPGISGWSGSFEGAKDAAPTAIGTEIALVLKESDTANQQWSGQAILTAIHPTTGYDGLVSYSYDFQGTGSLTVASA